MGTERTVVPYSQTQIVLALPDAERVCISRVEGGHGATGLGGFSACASISPLN
jgi:hypothetical protein